MNEKLINSTERERAAFVVEKLIAFSKSAGEGKTDNSAICSTIAGFPALIMTNGLGQSLAFLIKKSRKDNRGDVYGLTVETIVEWLNRQGMLKSRPGNYADLLTELTTIEMDRYLASQMETLKLIDALKIYSRVIFYDVANSEA